MWWYMKIGTCTSPGPCATHVAVGVSGGAGLGVMVGVWLAVGVHVALDGIAVSVGVGVLAANAALPQPHSRTGQEKHSDAKALLTVRAEEGQTLDCTRSESGRHAEWRSAAPRSLA